MRSTFQASGLVLVAISEKPKAAKMDGSMAPAFCPLARNDPHTALKIGRYTAFRSFDDSDELGAELTRIWKAKLALGCPQCARYRKHGNVHLCGRCQKLRRIISKAEIEISARIPVMLLTWRENNLSIEAYKVYKRAQELSDLGRRILRD